MDQDQNNEPLNDDDDTAFEGVYVIDDDTADILATAIGVLQMMSQAQLGEDHRDNLMIIAEELAARFGLVEDIDVEEVITANPDTGEQEILYRPLGGVMGDLSLPPEAEGEQPEQP